VRRRVAAPVTVLAAAAGLGLFAPAPAGASCVGPQITVPGAPSPSTTVVPLGGTDSTTVPVRLRAGSTVTVSGRYFANGCDDTGGGPAGPLPGCSAAGPPPAAPAQDVGLDLEVGGRVVRLGTADADQGYAVRWTVTLPPEVGAGSTGSLTTSSGEARLAVEFVP